MLLRSPGIWPLARRAPWLFSGAVLHRAGLHAYSAEDYEAAVGFFEAAAERYRRELRTEPLARVRVHQLMARACAEGGGASPVSLEVDRGLACLGRIESPFPPFELVPAHVLMAMWLKQGMEDGERLAA
jgi:hypothetical protein